MNRVSDIFKNKSDGNYYLVGIKKDQTEEMIMKSSLLNIDSVTTSYEKIDDLSSFAEGYLNKEEKEDYITYHLYYRNNNQRLELPIYLKDDKIITCPETYLNLKENLLNYNFNLNTIEDFRNIYADFIKKVKEENKNGDVSWYQDILSFSNEVDRYIEYSKIKTYEGEMNLIGAMYTAQEYLTTFLDRAFNSYKGYRDIYEKSKIYFAKQNKLFADLDQAKEVEEYYDKLLEESLKTPEELEAEYQIAQITAEIKNTLEERKSARRK